MWSVKYGQRTHMAQRGRSNPNRAKMNGIIRVQQAAAAIISFLSDNILQGL
jgi:hypothetical protein